MANFVFDKVFGTIMGLIIAGVAFNFYLSIYRKIPSLISFTIFEKRILVYQLLAVSLLTIEGLGIFFYTAWFGFEAEIFDKGSGIVIPAVLNWLLFGFIAVTSFVPGVSAISFVRSWREPSKGQESFINGILILALLVFWTWKVILPSL